MSGIRIVRPGEGRPWWWLGGIVRITASGEETEDRYMMEEAVVPPGDGPAPHIQSREDECFYVLDGGPLELAAGNRKVTLGAGGFVNIRSGTAHGFRNVGEAPAKVLIWNFPAGFERFQLEAGEEPSDPEAPREATDDDRRKVRDLAPRFGIAIDPDEGAFARAPDIRTIEAGTIESDSLGGQMWAPLATGEHTGGRFSMYRISVPPGEGAPAQHFEVDVGLYVLQGTLGLVVDGQDLEAPAGTLVQLRAQESAELRGTGDQRTIVLAWAAPAHDLARAVEAP